MVVTACILRSVFLTLFLSASAGDFAVLITFRNFRRGLT